MIQIVINGVLVEMPDTARIVMLRQHLDDSGLVRVGYGSSGCAVEIDAR